jgi:hypothetical protein
MKTIQKLILAAAIATMPVTALAEAVLVDGIYVSSELPKRTVDGTELTAAIHPSQVAIQESNQLESDVLELDFLNYCSFNGHDRSTKTSETLPCRKGGDYRAVLRGNSVEFFRLDGSSAVPLAAMVQRPEDVKKLLDFVDVRQSFGLPPL